MERFNLSFRRKGYFYMEGNVSIDLDVEGPALIADVIAKAEKGEFSQYVPTKLEYIEDDWQFGRMVDGTNVLRSVPKDEPLEIA